MADCGSELNRLNSVRDGGVSASWKASLLQTFEEVMAMHTSPGTTLASAEGKA